MRKLQSDVAMSLRGHRDDDSGIWWSGWKNHHWPADALRRGFRFYAYDKETRHLFAVVEVTQGSAFTYRTLTEYERKVKKVAGFWPGRDDAHFGRLPLPAKGKVCTGYAFRWRRVSTVSVPWGRRFPQLGWARIPSGGRHLAGTALSAFDDEGTPRMRKHLAAERKPWLKAWAKDHWRTKLGRLHCLVCGFDFERRYGSLGAEFIEMHHIKPIASRGKGQRTLATELIPLCANCHRMIHHKRRIPLTLEALTKIFRLTAARRPTRARAARAGNAER